MSFIKGKKDEVLVRVTAELNGDLGKKTKVPFVVTFKRYSVSESQVLGERIRNSELSDEDLLRAVVLDWRELHGTDEQEVPFSVEALHELAEIREYRVALVRAFMLQQYEIDIKNP